jgi:hypothetical protein
VSVEGPVVAIEPADLERDRRPLARRYFGAELGDQYIEGTRDLVENVLVRMRPEDGVPSTTQSKTSHVNE